MMDLLDSIHSARKLTSIHVTHNLSFASRADRIIALAQGHLSEPNGGSRASNAVRSGLTPASQEEGRHHV
jgi:ABC-type lipoprotein export system ATPase subunit